MAKLEPTDKDSKTKIIVLSAVILLAFSFAIYRFWPSGPVTPEVPAKDTVDLARQEIAVALKQGAGEYATVSAERTEQGGIVVTGYVESQALLDELKKRVSGLQLTVPTKIEVTLRTKR